MVARIFRIVSGVLAIGVLIIMSDWQVFAIEIEEFEGQYVVAGEVLVEYEDSVGGKNNPVVLSSVEQAMDVLSHKALKPAGDEAHKIKSQNRLANHYKAQFDRGSVKEKVKELETLEFVKSVQPNYIYVPLGAPDDAFYSLQWTHRLTGTDRAWDKTTGGDVIVGVIDTGIDYNHPDLAANMWSGTVEGQSVYGWNYYNNNNDPIDTFGHGTNVAGIIGAVGNNTLGVAGVNWKVKLMALRVLGAEHLLITNPSFGSSTITTTEAIMLAAEFAANQGALVINLSLGGIPSPLCDPAVGVPKKPIEEKFFHDLTYHDQVLFVVAAGNNQGNANCISPAVYDEVLVVTSTDNQDHASSYTNHAPASWKNTKVIAAPGGDADPKTGNSCSESTCPVTTNNGGNYVTFSGTSASTPYIAGTAALVLSVQDMDPLTLRQHLIDTADDFVDPKSLGAKTGITYGKRINVERALSALISPTPVATFSPAPTLFCGPAGDIDCSGKVNLFDLSMLLARFSTVSPAADIDGSGEVSVFDLSILLSNFRRN